MVEWDRKNRVLESWKFKVMHDVAIGLKPLTEKLKWGFRLNLKALLMKGFDELQKDVVILNPQEKSLLFQNGI